MLRLLSFSALLLIANLFLFVKWLHPTLSNTMYMDEIFHIQQTRQFICSSSIFEYRWDDKITTLPGLYLFFVFVYKLFMLNVETCESETPSSQMLFLFRLFNILCANLLFCLFYFIFRKSTISVPHSLLHSFRIFTFPLIYFFNYLFYTDILSLFTVFACFFTSPLLGNYFWTSFFFGLCSVLCRQTNIIWIFMIACFVLLEKHSLKKIIQDSIGYAIIGFLFVLFVYCNGGIVVGDKTNHQVIQNIPQFFFFAVFCCAMMPFTVLQFLIQERSWILSILANKLFIFSSIVCIGCISWLSYHFCVVHIFIYSDNRHYTFYLWRKLFHIHESGAANFYYALYSPIYYGCIVILCMMLYRRAYAWRMHWMLFLLCTALVVIPAPLIEFRYFIIPFVWLVWFISNNNLQQQSYFVVATLLDCCYCIAINAITLYVFVHKPFVYQNGNQLEEGRFMW